MVDSPVEARICPACLSDSIREHSPSRRTGHVFLQCRDCGLRYLRDRWSVEELAEAYDTDSATYDEWTKTVRVATVVASHDAILDRLSNLLGSGSHPRIFDVGAGDGGFLAQARDAGFQPAGNELSTGAIELAQERYGLTLHSGDLSTLEESDAFDAVTLWCVLAHVPEGDVLIKDVIRILRPGGLAYLQTPRWSAMDRLGQITWDITRGRWTRILDRRLAIHHMFLHTERSVQAQLKRLGLQPVSVVAAVRYSLVTDDYLRSLGVPPLLAKWLARPIDLLMERNWFPRNVLDIIARRPDEASR